MILTARQVLELYRGIEMLDRGYQRTDDDGSTKTLQYRNINVKTRLALAKNMASISDDYVAFKKVQHARIRAEELTETGDIKDPERATLVENELHQALLESKEYPSLRTIPEAALPLGDMPPTLIKMLLPILETDD